MSDYRFVLSYMPGCSLDDSCLSSILYFFIFSGSDLANFFAPEFSVGCTRDFDFALSHSDLCFDSDVESLKSYLIHKYGCDPVGFVPIRQFLVSHGLRP